MWFLLEVLPGFLIEVFFWIHCRARPGIGAWNFPEINIIIVLGIPSEVPRDISSEISNGSSLGFSSLFFLNIALVKLLEKFSLWSLFQEASKLQEKLESILGKQLAEVLNLGRSSAESLEVAVTPRKKKWNEIGGEFERKREI